MKSLLLIGGGGHCRSCIDVIEAEGRYQIRGIVQPVSKEIEAIFGYPVVGSDESLPFLLEETAQALVTVGQIRSPEIRMRLFELLKQSGGKSPRIVSPLAYCSKYAEMDEGTIVMHGAIVNAGAGIGANCIVNTLALIEHDVYVADHCHVSTGARVNGGVTIGKGSFIGSGAILKEGIVIGENVIIGAGQVILGDVPSGVVIKHGE
ncbi:NeuD/PglB/VioB family sugar acetyltransferase [Alphaproteobacteria bacterium LSUCC0744]